MKDFFAHLLGLITRNWGLKLLSLCLAILLYHALKPSVAHKTDTVETPYDRSIFQTR